VQTGRFGTTALSVSADELVPLIDSVINAGSPFKLTVTGGSMFPFLKDRRDSVLLISATDHVLKRGDIVLICRKGNCYILHRALKLLPDGFIMNGDAQIWTEFVSYSQVFAVVSKIERKGRLISCDNRFYRFLSELWMLLRPFRGFIFKVRRLLARIYRKIIPSK
jgi:hypothetical protein